MPDLNDWRLSYPGIAADVDFGPSSTPYPFEGQVALGEPDRTINDQAHGNADGLIMGRDILGGFDLDFTLTMLPTYPTPARPWANALDTFNNFKRAWRADPIRLNPYQYATLSNLDRTRMVWGRPRDIAQINTARLRRGVLAYAAKFTTTDPNFYSTTETTQTLLNNVSNNGNNTGNAESWPVITLTGPFTAGTLALRIGTTPRWTLTVPGPVAAGVALNIDARPWQRYVLLGTGPGNGLLRGDPLDTAKIPIGAFNFLWTRTDATNTSSAVAKWRPAYVSL